MPSFLLLRWGLENSFVQADFGIVIFLISASQVARMTDVR
jgi:hypothetical protein